MTYSREPSSMGIQAYGRLYVSKRRLWNSKSRKINRSRRFSPDCQANCDRGGKMSTRGWAANDDREHNAKCEGPPDREVAAKDSCTKLAISVKAERCNTTKTSEAV